MRASPRPTSPALPPAAGRLVPNHPGCNLDVSEVAELPEFLRRSGVLEEHLIDVEGVEFSGPETFDRQFHVANKLAELLLVVRRDGLAGGPTIRLGGHDSRLDGLGGIGTRDGMTDPTADPVAGTAS